MSTSKWTTADIPDQSGRTVVVTGANSGIGRHAARALAGHGAHVVLAVRDPRRGEQVARDMGDGVEVERLDLADLRSVHAFADAFARRHAGLDVLVNNAGVMALPRRETPDGFELQLGTNHLGHFALTGLLLDRLLARPQSRVVTVSSQMHRTGRIDFDDLQGERGYGRWRAYSQSKLANVLFAFELQRRVDAADLPLISAAVHPGYAATNLQRRGPEMEGSRVRGLLMRAGNVLFAQSDEMGALPTLYAATAPDLPGSAFVGPDGMGERRGHPRLTAPSAAAADEGVARRLWEVSEQLTGVRYDFAPVAA